MPDLHSIERGDDVVIARGADDGAISARSTLTDTMAVGTGTAGALVAGGSSAGWQPRVGPALVFSMAALVAGTA